MDLANPDIAPALWTNLPWGAVLPPLPAVPAWGCDSISDQTVRLPDYADAFDEPPQCPCGLRPVMAGALHYLPRHSPADLRQGPDEPAPEASPKRTGFKFKNEPIRKFWLLW